MTNLPEIVQTTSVILGLVAVVVFLLILASHE